MSSLDERDTIGSRREGRPGVLSRLISLQRGRNIRSDVGDERGQRQIQVDARGHRTPGLGVVRPAGAEAARVHFPAASDLGERGSLHEEEGLQRHG